MSVDWAAIYRATYEDLVRFLHRKVWDPDRARDLAQETFARALGQHPDNPRAWLFTVAGNLARDEARTAIRRRQHLALVKTEAEQRRSRDPHEEVEWRERMDAVKAALDQLGTRDREVLLFWDAGLSYDEIAARTGLARTAIGTTLARARRRLVEVYGALEVRHAARQ